VTDPVFTRAPMPHDTAIIDLKTGRMTQAHQNYIANIETMAAKLAPNTVLTAAELASIRKSIADLKAFTGVP
jgi:hypothetical protein